MLKSFLRFILSLTVLFALISSTMVFPAKIVLAKSNDEYLYDMGNGAVETDYTSVTKSTAYSASTGYGWEDINGIDERDRSTSDNLRSDFCFSNSSFTFNRDLSNGTWYVTVITGDAIAVQEPFNIYAEGVLSGKQSTLSAGSFNEMTFLVNVSDGQLNLNFTQNGGTWPVRVNTIIIHNFYPCSFDMGSGTVENDFVSVRPTTSYSSSTGYGWSSTTGLDERDRTFPDNIRRDFVFTHNSSMKFNCDVPRGKWYVKVITGDNIATQDPINIKSENIICAGVAKNIPAGEFREIVFNTFVSDGQLNLTFESVTSGLPIRVCSIEISMFQFEVPSINLLADVAINSSYGGQWTLVDDVDNDGQCEIISGRNSESNDVHGVCTLVVQEFNGAVKWTWGTAGSGTPNLHSDLGMQVYDIDNDAQKEILILERGSSVSYLKIFNASNGTLETIRALPEVDATDQIIICNLDGDSYKNDIIIKNRYHKIWGYDEDWNQLLYRDFQYLGHYPLAIDIDDDGQDEVVIGNYCLNSDGTTRWALNPIVADHTDCVGVLKDGNGVPGDYRFLLAMGYGGLYCIDGNGGSIWNYKNSSDHHQDFSIGDFTPQYSGAEISESIRYSQQQANRRGDTGEIYLEYGEVLYGGEHVGIVDWDDDGFKEIILQESKTIIKSDGTLIANLDAPSTYDMQYVNMDKSNKYNNNLAGDVDGDGRIDVLMLAKDSFGQYRMLIWKNTNGRQYDNAVRGMGVNWTLY